MQPEDFPLLNEICFAEREELVHTYPFIELAEGNVKLYYKADPNQVKSGFIFCAITPVTWEVTGEWSNCEIIYHGVAYFDGLRHLHMGSVKTDNSGYLYYHNLDFSIEIFTALKQLVAEYCRED